MVHLQILQIIFEKLAKKFLEKISHNVIVVTEDGSYGETGLVTDIMEKICQTSKFDAGSLIRIQLRLLISKT